MAYKIMLSEAQRDLLHTALLHLIDDEPQYIGTLINALTEENKGERYNLEFLPECLERLPKDEAEYPGVLHGLCL
jgi:hypothetical protein